VVIDDTVSGNACMAILLHIAEEVGEAFFPSVTMRRPAPVGYSGFESSCPLRIQTAFGVSTTLARHPYTEPEPCVIDTMLRDACMAMLFSEFGEPGKSFLPLISKGVPAPTRQTRQPASLVFRDTPTGIARALGLHPSTELKSVDYTVARNPRMTVLTNEIGQPDKTLLPLIGDRVPTPARQSSQPTLTIRRKRSRRLHAPLDSDPLAQPEPLCRYELVGYS
jgi:hypothetical protein